MEIRPEENAMPNFKKNQRTLEECFRLVLFLFAFRKFILKIQPRIDHNGPEEE
jgi:hypothetical protein